MDQSFVARQPILDREENLVGYELLFREGERNAFPDVEPDLATSKVLSSVYFNNDSYDGVLQDVVGFVNFPYGSIVRLIPLLLPRDKIVVEILENCEPTDELFNAIRELKGYGYKVALDDFVPTPAWRRFLPLVDFIKFDITIVPLSKVANLIQKLGHKISFVAERVETHEEFERCKELGFHFFQGYYFAKPELIKQKSIRASQLSILKLCQEVAKDELDIRRLESLFSADVGLSYKLFRLVNSLNLSSPIRSFRQALAYMGEDKIRLFVSLLALSSENSARPKPIYLMAIQRAYFCALIAAHLNLNRSDAYLVGLFSLLDSMFKVSFNTIFDSIKVDAAVRSAILNRQGSLGDVLRLTESYENANWHSITELNNKLKLSSSASNEYYTHSLNWGRLKVEVSTESG